MVISKCRFFGRKRMMMVMTIMMIKIIMRVSTAPLYRTCLYKSALISSNT